MEGLLKHKVQHADGILCWKSRHFLLGSRSTSLRVVDGSTDAGFADGHLDLSAPSAIIVSSPTGRRREHPNVGPTTSVTEVSLDGARRAVPWSGINAYNGCGFDLVWASGRSWSLLCDNPRTRKDWVDALNLAIDEAMANHPDHEIPPESRNRSSATVNTMTGDGTKLSPTRMRRRPRLSSTNGDKAGTGRRPPDIPRRTTPPVSFEALTAAPGYGGLNKTPDGRMRTGESRLFDEGSFPENSCSSIEACGGDDGRALETAVARYGNLDVGWSSGEEHNREFSDSHVGKSVSVCCKEDSEMEGPFARGDQQLHVSLDKEYSNQNIGSSHRRLSKSSAHGVDESRNSGTADYGCACGSDDGVQAGDNPRSFPEQRADRGSGGAGVGGSSRSKARQRSEELAKASAATWEKFQHLLKRSRESKDRFDRVMDGAVARSHTSGIADEKVVLTADRRVGPGLNGLAQARDVTSATEKGALVGSRKDVTVRHAAADSGNSRNTEHGTSKEVLSASSGLGCTTAGGNSSGPTAPSSSTVGSSTEIFSPDAAVRVDADGNGALRNKGRKRKVDGRGITGVHGTGAGRSMDEVHMDAIVEQEDNRLSFTAAVTDVEVSLIYNNDDNSNNDKTRDDSGRDQRGRAEHDPPLAAFDNGVSDYHGATGSADALRNPVIQPERDRVIREEIAEVVEAGKRTGVKPTCVSLSSSAPTAAIDGSVGAKTSTASREQHQLEAEFQTARNEASTYADRCATLEKTLEDANRERSRLMTELQTIKDAVAERANQVLNEKRVVEREKDGAKAELQELKRREQGRLSEVAEAWEKKMNEQRREAKRDTEELRAALSKEVEEKRRVKRLLDECSRSETLLRERSEGVAGEDLKARLTATQSELEAVARERDALAEELDQCIGRLGDQAREVAAALRSRHQREIAEVTSRCEVEKEALRETVTLEADERAREDKKASLLNLEKRLIAETAEAVRQGERLRTKQVAKMKAQADAAAEATRKDIEKLQGLHKKRVSRLEALLREEGDSLAEARREIAICKATLAGDAGEFQRWTEEQRDQSKRVLEELAQIQQKVAGAVKLEAEAREREGLAMGRLRKVMEEARLERAESIEVRRQLREALAELESNRNAQARRARTDIQLQRAVEIAQQEVAMLEAERVRWHEERRSTEAAMDKLTRLVYGPPRISNHNNANMTTTHTDTNAAKLSRRNTASHRWKSTGSGSYPWRNSARAAGSGGGKGSSIPGGARRASASGAGGHNRTACSSIGTNRGNRGSVASTAHVSKIGR